MRHRGLVVLVHVELLEGVDLGVDDGERLAGDAVVVEHVQVLLQLLLVKVLVGDVVHLEVALGAADGELEPRRALLRLDRVRLEAALDADDLGDAEDGLARVLLRADAHAHEAAHHRLLEEGLRRPPVAGTVQRRRWCTVH